VDDFRLRANWRAVHAFNRAKSNDINNKMKTLIRSLNRSPLRGGCFTLSIALCCVAFSPVLKAADCPTFCDGGVGGNTALGNNALDSVNSGGGGINNTAVGFNALTANTTGFYNVAVGSGALQSNTTGTFNMAIGAEALKANNSNFNLAIGFRTLFQNTSGNHNTGIGAAALRNNTTAGFNVGVGADALRENTTGPNNTAVGASALSQNTTGTGNTAIGSEALFSNTASVANTAVGLQALASMTTGTANTAIGASALDNLTTGSFNIVVGQGGAGILTASNVICIGSDGANTSNTTWLGNIFGVTTISGTTAPVVVSDGGQLGTIVSSERFKKDISSMEKASEPILALRPVTFHYKSDTKNTPQFGLIAEEVAKVNPALVLPDKEGKPYTVRYDAVNAMLLNEFLKEHQKVQDLEKQVEKLTAGLQKVSAQLEASKPAPQVVNNP
jgi:endosialidase-like protein